MSKHQHAVGHVVLIYATIVNIPSSGPFTLQIGKGESPGHNVSVDPAHIIPCSASPEEPPQPITEPSVPSNVIPIDDEPTSDPAVLTKQLEDQAPAAISEEPNKVEIPHFETEPPSITSGGESNPPPPDSNLPVPDVAQAPVDPEPNPS